jgi:hypothetical protein
MFKEMKPCTALATALILLGDEASHVGLMPDVVEAD